MLTKAFIEERKLARDSEFFIKTLAATNSERDPPVCARQPWEVATRFLSRNPS